ncbi:MAG TPA: DUF2156 domain-containing protein [Ktedonobacterales bacterium]
MRGSRRIVCFYYGVAVVNIVSALLPIWPWRFAVLHAGLPLAIILTAQSAAVLLGMAMLLLAYPAAQRHRRSARLLTACALCAVAANLLKGLDFEEAVLNAVLWGMLWRGRHQLEDFPLRYTIVDLARLGIFLALLDKLYSLTGVALIHGLHTLAAGGPFGIPLLDATIDTVTGKLPLQRHWFHESQIIVPLFLVALFGLFSWWSALGARGHADDAVAAYDRFGRASHNSLAYLANRDDVSTFSDPDGRGAITYRRVGRVAVQIGAILCAPGETDAVYRAFRAYCKHERLVPAAVALTSQERDAVRMTGMRALPIGTEAVVDLSEFAVERLSKKMRWVQRSLRKRGYHVALLCAAEIPAALRLQLNRIDSEWRSARGGEAHGCCMTLGRVPTNADRECLIALAAGADGEPVAYLTLLPGGEGYYSLDLTRRLSAAPNAIVEFLLLDVLERLRDRGAAAVSLNFSTFSSLPALPGGAVLLRTLNHAFQLSSLEAFNSKFKPRWEPRYLAFPSLAALPDVIYAVLALEGIGKMVLNAGRRAVRRQLGAAPVERTAPGALAETA